MRFTSFLGPEHRDDLEQMLFFNPHQRRVLPGIVDSVDRYGTPRIVVERSRLSVTVEGLPDVQTLFAVDDGATPPSLAGVLVHARPRREQIVILHVAVREEFAASASGSDTPLVMRLVAEVRAAARRLRGVRTLVFIYGDGTARRIPVR